MVKTPSKKIFFVFVVAALLVLGVGFSGCIGEDDVNDEEDDEEDGEDDNGEDDNGEDDNGEDDDNGFTGSDTYSGEWSGSIGGEDYSGIWEFDVDFDEEEVTGWFDGDGSGDIAGTVSEGEIEASGTAGFGTVEWSGDFTTDGEGVSGTWELSEGAQYGSGTWNGELGEAENGNGDDDDDDEENGLPSEDDADGDEPLDRYPDSVMLSYYNITTDDGWMIQIGYGTEDISEDVVDWYKEELGDPDMEGTDGDETTLTYMFEEGEEQAHITVSENDHTSIDLQYIVSE